jgi:integrase
VNVRRAWFVSSTSSRSWVQYAGEQAPKSKAGTRKAPIPKLLGTILREHKLRTGRSGSDFVFGLKADRVFTTTNIRKRALVAWKNENAKWADKKQPLLNPIGLHELRHSAISMWFQAGLQRERIEDFAGHSSGKVTDLYRKVLPGQFEDDLEKLDEYLGTTLKVAAVS